MLTQKFRRHSNTSSISLNTHSNASSLKTHSKLVILLNSIVMPLVVVGSQAPTIKTNSNQIEARLHQWAIASMMTEWGSSSSLFS